MSTWNNRCKRFSSTKEEKIQNFLQIVGGDIWDDFNREVREKFDGRIEYAYSDHIKGVIDLGDDRYVSILQFNEDCKQVNKMINELLKKVVAK